MSLRTVSGVMLTLLLIGTIASTVDIRPVIATGTIYIRPDGSVDPPDAPIKRIGDFYLLTDDLFDCLEVQRDNITIHGNNHTVHGGFSGTGIDLSGRINVNLLNTTVTGFEDGIWIDDTRAITLLNNKVYNNSRNGVRGIRCINVFLNNNVVYENGWIGIAVEGSNITVVDNMLFNNVRGIYLSGCWNVAKHNTAHDNTHGIHFACFNSSLVENTICNNSVHGIWGRYFPLADNNITGNHISHNERGIFLDAGQSAYCAYDNFITRNFVDSNGVGIFFLRGYGDIYDNFAEENTVLNNEYGIVDYRVLRNTYCHNNIANNTYGIYTYGGSSEGRIYDNNITENTYGIYVESVDARIYHNNFINNTNQVQVPYLLSNTWDDGYPRGGNYWSDYTFKDEYSGSSQNLPGSDGIGDIFYYINENNTDRYPLIRPRHLLVHNLNTSLHYCTIQEAIDAPETLEGHTIKVDAELYYEDVKVHKALTFIGENRSTTIVDAMGLWGYALTVKANSVTIKNFTIQGGDVGVLLNGSLNCLIDGNDIRYCIWGIYFKDSSQNTIHENILHNNDYPLVLVGSERNKIARNNIADNGIGVYCWQSRNCSLHENNVTRHNAGVILEESGGATMRGNRISNGSRNFGVIGFDISDFIQDIDTSNTIDEKPIYYWINKHDMVAPADTGYIAAVNCTDITVEDLSLMKNIQGVLFVHTANSTIENMNITYNEYGLHLYESNNISISGNNITWNSYCGIFLDRSNNNTVNGNHITNDCYSISLSESYNNLIEKNNIVSHAVGIYSKYSHNNTINRNNITDGQSSIELLWSCGNIVNENNLSNNVWWGMQIGRSDNNIVSANNITSNVSYHIILAESGGNLIVRNNLVESGGIGIGVYGSYSNSIYYNNFINNTQHVDSVNSANAWDDGYPHGGNYWSDYTGVDFCRGPYQNETGSDGMGDKPYVIDADNADSYPLMNLWSSHDIAVVSVKPYRRIVGQGRILFVNVTVENQGLWLETFNVTLYAFMMPPAIPIATLKVYNLAPETLKTLTFAWNTSGFGTGIYTISAFAEYIPSETDRPDNTYVNGIVQIVLTAPGGGGCGRSWAACVY